MLPQSYTAVHRYDGAIIQRQRHDHPEPCVLRQRDLAIVRDVWRYHFLTTNQLRDLWWPGKSLQATRRRLVKLLRAGYLERFRPHSPRGSYEWTYFLSARGHHLLRQLGVVDPAAHFRPREVFDYGRAVHDIQLNAWVLAYRRLLGSQLVDWHGEQQITPPRETRQAQPRLDDHWSIEGLHDPHPRPVVPDATLEIRRPSTGRDAAVSARVRPHQPHRQELRQVPPLRRLPRLVVAPHRTRRARRGALRSVHLPARRPARRLPRPRRPRTHRPPLAPLTPRRRARIHRPPTHPLLRRTRRPPRPLHGPPAAPIPVRTPRQARPRRRDPWRTTARPRRRQCGRAGATFGDDLDRRRA
jgi:hypothetical protein